MEIQESKTVWLTMTNENLTDGYGKSKILFVCEQKETARRLGKKGYIQGSDCPVERATAVKISGVWLVPGNIQQESDSDKKIRIANEERDAVLNKMRDAGFSEEEIAKLNR
ncbi:hypothetical protein [Pantoea sp.]|uniref:hypothetical protein n=1 Tax=Pantoea sp. TaxID=69393 RepID=UPI0031E030FC